VDEGNRRQELNVGLVERPQYQERENAHDRSVSPSANPGELDKKVQYPKFPGYRFSLNLFLYTLLVIVWGVFVRASFSGDGCGTHWPLCDGSILPVGKEVETYIELGHRVSSGIIGPLVLWLVVLARRTFPKGHFGRKMAMGTLFFTLTEGAVGAKLVLKGYVAGNFVPERALWMSIHLVNTLILLTFLVGAVWAFSGRTAPRLKNQGPVAFAIGFAFLGMLVLGVSGAVAALGDMVDPSRTLAQGLRADFDQGSHFLVRLRLAHPLIATSIGVYMVFLASFLAKARSSEEVRRWGKWTVGIFAFQLLFGLANLLMLAPIPMQLGHLLIADLLWCAALLMSFAALDPKLQPAEVPSPAISGPEPTLAVPKWKSFWALTKPRVVSLLLFTTITAAFVAKGGWPGGWVVLALLVGGYAAAGSANAINMVYDRDIDQRMVRTSTRPTVTHAVTNAEALIFAAILGALSFGLLWGVCNLLTACLAMAGLAFYVLVYTMALKRRTWHNIVIGGAAGAFPPLVGYAGVTGDLSPLAWVLFGIIFLWTPVHFWALALLIQDDYRDAGVPMLPVVRGERATVIQIALYTVLTAVVSVLPLFMGKAGMLYLVFSTLLNAVLVLRTVQLMQVPEKAQARSLFKYSMVYLAVLFMAIAVDRAQVF